MVFKSFLTLTLLVTGCLVLTSLRLQRDARSATAERQSLEKHSADAAPAQERSDQALVELRTEITRLRVTAERLRGIVYENEPEISPEAAAETERAEFKSQEEQARGFRAQLAARYGAFYLQQKLTREQIDRWEAIQVEQWHAEADLKAVATKLDLSPDDAARAKLARESDDRSFDAEATVLGAENMRALLDYRRAEAAYDVVSVLAQKLYTTETPLERVQAERLAQLLKEKNPAYKNNHRYDPEQTPWPEVIAEARTFLSPAAAQILMNFEARQRFSKAATAIMERFVPLFAED
jgi:TolA-binding protein